MQTEHYVPILLCPLIPITGLFFGDAVFRNITSRLLVIFLSISNTVLIVRIVQFENQMLAFLFGLFAPWMTLRTITFFLIYNSPKEFLLTHVIRNRSFELQWRAFPATRSLARLLWAVDLVLDSRAIAWCYSATDCTPCKHHKEKASKQEKILNDRQGQVSNLAYVLTIRFLVGLVWIEICQTRIFPTIREASGHKDLLQSWLWHSTAFRLLAVWTASFALVDLVYTGSRLLSCFMFILGCDSSLISITQPSPWGSPASLFEHGIGGYWGGFWHDYFKLGFQTTARWVFKPLEAGMPRSLRKITELFSVFFLSAIMHMCASFMFKHQSNPLSKQLVFFMLQPVGILFQRYVNIALKIVFNSKMVHRGITVIFFMAWFRLTLPLLIDDMMNSGFWDRSIIGLHK